MQTYLSKMLGDLGDELQVMLEEAQADVTAAQQRLGGIPPALLQNGSVAAFKKADKLLDEAFNELLQLRILLHRPFPTQELMGNAEAQE
jgi:hypothetical protein